MLKKKSKKIKLDKQFKNKLEKLFSRKTNVITTSSSATNKQPIKKINKHKNKQIKKIEKIEMLPEIQVIQPLSEIKKPIEIIEPNVIEKKIKPKPIENEKIIEKLIDLNIVLIEKEINKVKQKYLIIDKTSFLIGIGVSFLLYKYIF